MAHTHEHNGNGTCVECAVPQLARNNYFTGKLLVERDFREEQDYFLGKDRRHNQELHGWGVVCGLKVKQHPREDCPRPLPGRRARHRDRLLRPGDHRRARGVHRLPPPDPARVVRHSRGRERAGEARDPGLPAVLRVPDRGGAGALRRLRLRRRRLQAEPHPRRVRLRARPRPGSARASGLRAAARPARHDLDRRHVADLPRRAEQEAPRPDALRLRAAPTPGA